MGSPHRLLICVLQERLTVRAAVDASQRPGVERTREGCHPATGTQTVMAEVIKRVVDLTLHEKPSNSIHWSERHHGGSGRNRPYDCRCRRPKSSKRLPCENKHWNNAV